jgi:hypothetical protein
MTATELFAARSSESWNYQHEWSPVLSANEWVLGRHDGNAQIPMEYALRLLLDHFGPDRLKQHIDAMS